MKKVTINVLLTFGAIITGLVAIEICARLFVGVPSPYPMPSNIEVYDKRGFATLRPGFEGLMDNRVDFVKRPVTIGANGERLVPCEADMPDKHPYHQIFLLGDSQTFGYGLGDNETWANQMSCALIELLGPKIAVINLGVPGTNVHHYWTRGRRQVVPGLRADDVVIVSITWNDLIDFYKGETWLDRVLSQAGLKRVRHKLLRTRDSRDLSLVAEGSPDAIRIDLDHEWARVNHIMTWRQQFYELTGLLVPDIRSLRAFANSMAYTSALFRLISPQLRMLYYRLRGRAPMALIESSRKLRLNAMTLVALQRFINRTGAKMLVQILPNRIFFDDYYYRAYSKNGLIYPNQDYTGHVMLPLCKVYGLDCVNRFDVLKTSERDAHTFSFDGHFNPKGAVKIGEALAKDLFARLKP